MAINIKFDLIGNPEPPTIILSTRNGNKLGQLDVNVESIELTDKFNDASEFTFTLNKYIDGKITNLWNDVVNFKLVYCKEWDMWFEITVELDEETETVKTVLCTQLGQAELSQLMLYNIEINTEKDIERDDYKIAILYDAFNPDASILHRILKDKAPHYSIIHVDSTIARIQRSFSFDDISIYDAMQEIAEEIGCLFVFHSNSNDFVKNIVTEDSTILYENLVNEQNKIKEWGLSEFGSAFDISDNNFAQHKFGNVDMDNRIIITWSNELKNIYSNALSSWNYNPEVGSIDTVFGGSSRFGENVLATGIEVAYTPIVNINGEAIFINKNILYNYIEELVSESVVNDTFSEETILRLDKNGRYIDGIFIQNVIAATDESLNYNKNNNWAETVGRLMHFSGKYGAVSLAQNDIIEYAENNDISFKEFIAVHRSDVNKQIQRTISVYDLESNCNSCKHRGEFTCVCPECGSSNITEGYGEDTTIFVTSDELASNGIQLTTDIDAVKNCFKLEAGDDLMTATIRNCNPNGTDYIWRFSDDMKKDMSSELVEKIESYDKIYKQYHSKHIFELDANLLNNYNALVDKYLIYDKELQKIESPVKGYSSLMNAYYNTIDLSLYLESGLMPSVEMSGTTAAEQANLLTESLYRSTVAVANTDTVSEATANTAVLAMAKVIVRPTYKIQVNASELSNDKKTWTGSFIITNYSDEEDTFISSSVPVYVSDDVETFVKQKIEKALNKENTDDLSITGLFKKEYNTFCTELKKYALNSLTSFYDACQSCIDILIEQGAGSDENSDLYKNLYFPYYNKLSAIEAEIKIREDEINSIIGTFDANNELISDGLQTNIENHRNKIQDFLNFEKYLGEELWLEFCSHRREDKYTNENYISDGLTNAELFKNALEFFDVAKNEIYKSSELQHSISTTLNNLLSIPKFKPFIQYFDVGNWIRIQIDDVIYKLRLIEYSVDFGNFESIPVEFSDVANIKNGITDVRSVFEQASSMATSYSSVQRQAGKGNKVKNTVDEWVSNGLNAAYVQIQSNDNEEVSFTKNGLLCRTYDDVTDTYSPEQLKLTHNIMAYTDDNWETVRQAIGKHDYKEYDKSKKEFVNNTGYGMTAQFVTAGVVNGSQIIGGDIYSDNYSAILGTGSYIDLRTGEFSFGGGALKFDAESGELSVSLTDATTVEQITKITKDTVTTSYVNALGVRAGSVSADDITSGTIEAKISIESPTITGAEIYGGKIFAGEDDKYYAAMTDTSFALMNINSNVPRAEISADTNLVELVLGAGSDVGGENGRLYLRKGYAIVDDSEEEENIGFLQYQTSEGDNSILAMKDNGDILLSGSGDFSIRGNGCKIYTDNDGIVLDSGLVIMRIDCNNQRVNFYFKYDEDMNEVNKTWYIDSTGLHG